MVNEWFSDGKMKANPGKFHLLTSTKGESKICINDDFINSSKDGTLLGIMIDSNLNFNTYINVICKNEERKISVLSTITPFMELLKRRLFMKVFFMPQSSYCLLPTVPMTISYHQFLFLIG